MRLQGLKGSEERHELTFEFLQQPDLRLATRA